MTSPRIGIYPGTFDPVTLGHFDIIQRASRLVDTLIIGVAKHSGKQTQFTLEQRIQFIEEHLPDFPHNGTMIKILPIEGLLVEFAHSLNATVVFRGLRAVADFDYEFQMAMMNARLAADVETVFLMASERNQFIASKLVKEVAILGGDVAGFVPKKVAEALKKL
jgi:pantetheine-phosphate adenylyltransferase